ncbi:MAG TPA: thiamine diphosphokinase [Bacillales bacterium]|nr:thiamine diphosphokinase [Bacillales bacterium]
MKVHILAGGPNSLIPELKGNEENVVWIGVDRGVYELIQRGLQPSYAFGDFDSLSEAERQVLRSNSNVYTFPQEKDKTDLELAVDWALDRQPQSITLFGATGGRLDHEWANIRLLEKGVERKTDMEIIDRQNTVTAHGPGRYVISENDRYPYVSFLPLNESISGLTLQGFKYPLLEKDVKSGMTLTVSNELIAETGTYSFTDGIVLVIRSHDSSSS